MSSPNTSGSSLILDVTSTSSDPPESPLDVLSRAATMVESAQTSPVPMEGAASNGGSPPTAGNSRATGCERSPSFKERTHPKFRKSNTPDYLMAADQARHKLPLQRQGSNESSSQGASPMEQDSNSSDQPLDMSVKKSRSDSPPPPPPYKYTPLSRRGSPPRLEAPPQMPQQHYLPPPPYPCNNSPSPPAAAMAALPPPPSYESSTRGKKVMLAPDSTTPPIGMPPSGKSDRCESPPRTTIREITIITADSSADPLLDEHFRRSLGANYKNLFKKDGGKSASTSPPPASLGMPPQQHLPGSRSPPLMSSSPNPRAAPSMQMEQDRKRPKTEQPETNGGSGSTKDPVRAFEEDMQGYTVEDHFAKALGDTWLKLQAQKKKSEQEAKQGDSKAKVLAL